MENRFVKKAVWIVRKLQRNGFEAVFAGGAVRDRLLGIVPVDIDVATSASAEEVCNIFPGSGKVGKAFGVVLVKGDDPPIEVASFRVDGPYKDGRRPEWVKPASAREDAERRDFTINGMFYDPVLDKFVDFVGGGKDLENGIIRAIGEPDTRFDEDYLRLYRAVRFASRLGFRIEEQTLSSMKKQSHKAKFIAAERVRDELSKIFSSANADYGLQIMADCGLLKFWLPEIDKMQGVPQPKLYHPEGDVFEHTRKALTNLTKPSSTLAWGTLLHDVGKPEVTEISGDSITSPLHARVGAEMVETIAERLKFSNKDTAQIKALVDNHMRFVDYPRMKESTRKRFLAMDRFAEHLALHRADSLASNGNTKTYEEIAAELKKKPQPKLPSPLISGDDLITLDFQPGPLFKRILFDVREKQLNGEIIDRIEALDHVMAVWKQGADNPATADQLRKVPKAPQPLKEEDR